MYQAFGKREPFNPIFYTNLAIPFQKISTIDVFFHFFVVKKYPRVYFYFFSSIMDIFEGAGGGAFWEIRDIKA